MKHPLALIEFVAFIGVVVWLFMQPSSPLRRDGTRDGDTAAGTRSGGQDDDDNAAA